MADVTMTLSHDEALVFLGWLAREDDRNAIVVEHPAEQTVLWRLEAQLERQLVDPFAPDYDRLVAAARDRIDGAERGGP